jgi:hypothetical protein
LASVELILALIFKNGPPGIFCDGSLYLTQRGNNNGIERLMASENKTAVKSTACG